MYLLELERSGIAGSHGNSTFSFVRNFHTVPHSDSTHLHPHQQHRRVPFSPHSLLHLSCVDFLMRAILTCVTWYLAVALIWKHVLRVSGRQHAMCELLRALSVATAETGEGNVHHCWGEPWKFPMRGSHISPRWTEGPSHSEEGGTIRYQWTEPPWDSLGQSYYHVTWSGKKRISLGHWGLGWFVTLLSLSFPWSLNFSSVTGRSEC